MWPKLKQKVKDMLMVFSGGTKNNELVAANTQECLKRLEKILNKSVDSDIQLEVSGEWVSKSLIEAISANSSEQKLLKISRQKEVFQLETIFPKEIVSQLEILWSGCYSEVFRVKNMNGEDIVLKVSLINRMNKDGVVVQNASTIMSDVLNSKRLSDLKTIPIESADNYCENFANVKSFLYVWSNRLVFNKSEYKGKDPKAKDPKAKYEYFISQQTFGGKQLDLIYGLSPTKGLSLVLQLIASLAVAEECLHFEHRDLHTCNILIKRTDEKYASYSINGQKFRVQINGIKLTIIDTTFSRTEIKTDSKEGKEVTHYLFNDLSTLNLEDYPNSEMKTIYLLQKEITSNKWQEFCPKTNIIWLTYCVNKILKKVEKWSQKNSIEENSICSNHLSQLKKIKETVGDSNSAKDLARICQLF